MLGQKKIPVFVKFTWRANKELFYKYWFVAVPSKQKCLWLHWFHVFVQMSLRCRQSNLIFDTFCKTKKMHCHRTFLAQCQQKFCWPIQACNSYKENKLTSRRFPFVCFQTEFKFLILSHQNKHRWYNRPGPKFWKIFQ